MAGWKSQDGGESNCMNNDYRITIWRVEGAGWAWSTHVTRYGNKDRLEWGRGS